jgi:hypothetical protein
MADLISYLKDVFTRDPSPKPEYSDNPTIQQRGADPSTGLPIIPGLSSLVIDPAIAAGKNMVKIGKYIVDPKQFAATTQDDAGNIVVVDPADTRPAPPGAQDLSQLALDAGLFGMTGSSLVKSPTTIGDVQLGMNVTPSVKSTIRMLEDLKTGVDPYEYQQDTGLYLLRGTRRQPIPREIIVNPIQNPKDRFDVKPISIFDETVPLSEVYNNPALYNRYPELQDMFISSGMLRDGLYGRYVPQHMESGMSIPASIEINNKLIGSPEFYRTTGHEISHAVVDQELAAGLNPMSWLTNPLAYSKTIGSSPSYELNNLKNYWLRDYLNRSNSNITSLNYAKLDNIIPASEAEAKMQAISDRIGKIKSIFSNPEKLERLARIRYENNLGERLASIDGALESTPTSSIDPRGINYPHAMSAHDIKLLFQDRSGLSPGDAFLNKLKKYDPDQNTGR